MRTKLSCYKIFHRISTGNRNEKTETLKENKFVHSQISI